MKYEYNVVPVKIGRVGLFDDSKKQVAQLNELGRQGWKLITISEGKSILSTFSLEKLLNCNLKPLALKIRLVVFYSFMKKLRVLFYIGPHQHQFLRLFLTKTKLENLENIKDKISGLNPMEMNLKN